MGHEFLFDDRPEDIARVDLRLTGTLPAGLEGSFLAIGPGRTRLGGAPLHLFDSYGRLLSAKIADGAVALEGKHVRTPVLQDDLRRGAVSQRRLFANKPGRWANLFSLGLGNNCMHNAYAFGRHVMVAQDPGHFRIDPRSLDVIGPLDFGGLLKKGMNVTPMPRIDPASGHLVVWLQKPGPHDTVNFLELSEGLEVARRQEVKLPGPGLMHDVAFTKDYYLAIRFGELSLPKLLWGARPVIAAIAFDPSTTPELYLVPRAGGKPLRVRLPGRTHFHMFNAFQEDGILVVDTTGYAGKVTFSSLMPEALRQTLGIPLEPAPMPEVVRYRIDLGDLSVTEQVMPGAVCEAPAINPRVRGGSYRYGYALSSPGVAEGYDRGASFWFGALAKLDFVDQRVQVWSAGAGKVCSAPVFIPDPERGAEDGGWLLSWVQDPERVESTLCVFDAERVEQGPLAQATYAGLFGMVSHVDFSLLANEADREAA